MFSGNSPKGFSKPKAFPPLAMLLVFWLLACPAFAAQVSLTRVGTHATGIFDEGAAEIVAYDATDVSDPADSENGRMVGSKTPEECTAAELAAAGIQPVEKTLGYNLLANMSSYPHDKPEGFELVDNRYLMVINDDDFGVTDDGNGGLAEKNLPLSGNKDSNILYIIDLLK